MFNIRSNDLTEDSFCGPISLKGAVFKRVFKIDRDPEAVFLGRGYGQTPDRAYRPAIATDDPPGVVPMKANPIEMTPIPFLVRNAGRLWMGNQTGDDVFEVFSDGETGIHECLG